MGVMQREKIGRRQEAAENRLAPDERRAGAC